MVVPVVVPVEPDVVVTGAELLPEEELIVVVLDGGVAVEVVEVEPVEDEPELPPADVTGVLVVLELPVELAPEVVPEVASKASTQTQYPPDEEFLVPDTWIFKV